MTAAAIDNALDVANWFFKRAEKEDQYLENAKLQHLLFLAQIHFALANHHNALFPAVFAAGPDGYYEPNLAKALSFGRPLMPAPSFNAKINSFLELIWKKYAALNVEDLSCLVRDSTSHAANYQRGRTNLIDLEQLANQFKNQLQTGRVDRSRRPHKVLISQNGPVVVSPWQPRKINPSKEENTHA